MMYADKIYKNIHHNPMFTIKKGQNIMSVHAYLYKAGDLPQLAYKESRYIEHLTKIGVANDYVRMGYMTTFDYPSYVICKPLEAIGLLDTRTLERVGAHRGKQPLGYSLSENGVAMLEQHGQFMDGYQEKDVHRWRELLGFWKAIMPSRYLQYYASLVMIDCPPHSLKEAIGVLGQMKWFNANKRQDDTLPHPIARAIVEIVVQGGAPAAIGIDSANMHSINENAGAAMSVRINGFDMHNLEHIFEYLGTDSRTYLMQYLITLGACVALANRAVPE